MANKLQKWEEEAGLEFLRGWLSSIAYGGDISNIDFGTAYTTYSIFQCISC